MNQPSLLALGASTIVCALIVAGCGGYTSDPPAPTAGTGGSTGGTGGSTAGTGGSTAGTGGSTAGTGGSTAGTGGSIAGMGGTGGDAAGSSGQAGASGSAGSSSGAGGGGALSCPATLPSDGMPCGGADVAGTWTVAPCMVALTGMVNLSGLGLANDCMAMPITTGSLEVSGTFTLNGDGTYSDATTTTGEETFELAPPCLELSGTTTTCDQIAGPIKSVGFDTLTCLDNAATGGCTCSGTLLEQEGGMGFMSYDAATSGTFMLADTTMSVTSFADPTTYGYCVSGNTLTMAPMVNKTGTIMGPIVLQK